MEVQGGGSMASGGGPGGGGGGDQGAAGGGLKKGPWTPAEDELLVGHVRRHGEGSWNAVRRETGLRRCGKSCRLRWANHLRPNLKRGPFSPDEERLILRLHALIGNKWARISAHLQGRTDNEIKNYWNTRLKRRKRAGLALYPPEVEREVALIRASKLIPIVDADGNANADNASLLQAPLLLDAADPFAWPSPAPLYAFNNVAAQEPPQPQPFHFTGGNNNPQTTTDATAQPPYHHHDAAAAAGLDHGGKHYAGARALGLPPLPPAAQELPSNQSSAADAMGVAGGLLEMLVLEQDHQLAGAALLRVTSMPELVCHDTDYSAWPSGIGGGSGSRSEGDVTSHYGGKRDSFFEDAMPATKRRAASSAVEEEEISDLFSAAFPGEWLGGGGDGDGDGVDEPAAAANDDDDYNLQMQHLVSPVQLSSDEHGWN